MYTVITDMDKTIIYSKTEDKEVICVEADAKGRPITYMTTPAKNKLKELFARGDFNFIPCTLRSIEQVSRVHFIDQCKTIICDNGGSIYVSGEIDKEWDKQIEKIIDKNDVAKRREMAEQYAINNNIDFYKMKSNRDCFVSLIFYSLEVAQKHLDEFKELFPDTYEVHNQGKKIYFVPKGLNKRIAVDYIMSRTEGTIFTAGDSSVDECFVGAGDVSIIPGHATFAMKKALQTASKGIKAGEDIIEIIASIIETCDKS